MTRVNSTVIIWIGDLHFCVFKLKINRHQQYCKESNKKNTRRRLALCTFHRRRSCVRAHNFFLPFRHQSTPHCGLLDNLLHFVVCSYVYIKWIWSHLRTDEDERGHVLHIFYCVAIANNVHCGVRLSSNKCPSFPFQPVMLFLCFNIIYQAWMTQEMQNMKMKRTLLGEKRTWSRNYWHIIERFTGTKTNSVRQSNLLYTFCPAMLTFIVVYHEHFTGLRVS